MNLAKTEKNFGIDLLKSVNLFLRYIIVSAAA